MPRLDAELRDEGARGARQRSARLRRAAGLVGVSRRAGPRPTRRDRTARPAPDLGQRAFAASAPNRFWGADITCVPTWAGGLSLAVVGDAWSRRVVGWAMATPLRTEWVLDARALVVPQRRPAPVSHPSAQGCQYTALAFGPWCREMGVRPSMGTVGDADDKALCESFFATLETALLDRRRFPPQAEARLAVFEFIEGWSHPHRRPSSRDSLSPIRFERRYQVA